MPDKTNDDDYWRGVEIAVRNILMAYKSNRTDLPHTADDLMTGIKGMYAAGRIDATDERS